MNSHNQNPSREESITALASVHQAQTAIGNKVRSPLWLTLVSTFLLGFILYSNWIGAKNPTMFVLTFTALGLFFALWGAYILILKRRGLHMNFFPKSAEGRRLLVLQLVFYFAVLILTDWLLARGLSWVPWVAIAIICLCFAAVLNRYPTGELLPRSNAE